jgi:hypothetical protein
MAFKIKINKKVTGDSPYGTNKFQLQDLPIMKVHYSTVLYVTKKNVPIFKFNTSKELIYSSN